MKKYKELTAFLAEMGPENTEVGGGDAQSAHSHYGVHRIENPEQLGRINAFLNAMTQREFLDPKAAIVQMRWKMNQAGLDFDFTGKEPMTEGSKDFHITRYGGTFGKSPTTPHDEFERTDGISEFNNGKGLALRVTVEQAKTGMYNIDASIIPSEGKSDKPISL